MSMSPMNQNRAQQSISRWPISEAAGPFDVCQQKESVGSPGGFRQAGRQGSTGSTAARTGNWYSKLRSVQNVLKPQIHYKQTY